MVEMSLSTRDQRKHPPQARWSSSSLPLFPSVSIGPSFSERLFCRKPTFILPFRGDRVLRLTRPGKILGSAPEM